RQRDQRVEADVDRSRGCRSIAIELPVLQTSGHSRQHVSGPDRGHPHRRHRRAPALSRFDARSARVRNDATVVRGLAPTVARSACRPPDQRRPRAVDPRAAAPWRRAVLSGAGSLQVTSRRTRLARPFPGRRVILFVVLAGGVSIAVCSLVLLAYRAVGEWRRSTTQLVDQRSEEALTLL